MVSPLITKGKMIPASFRLYFFVGKKVDIALRTGQKYEQVIVVQTYKNWIVFRQGALKHYVPIDTISHITRTADAGDASDNKYLGA